VSGSARISDDGCYRYTLVRHLQVGLQAISDHRQVLFIMLNPSTADADHDDATIRRCMNFAARWDFAELHVGNLYAYRATDPDELADQPDAIGPDNDLWLERLASSSKLVVVAWGAHWLATQRAWKVIEICQLCGHDATTIRCLGLTVDGYPRHPLYVRADTGLMPYLLEEVA
jgi:hypothetical protein